MPTSHAPQGNTAEIPRPRTGRQTVIEATSVAPPTVQRVIDSYTADVPADHWAAIGSFVRESVTSFGPQTTGVARNYLAAVAKFAHWMWQSTGADLDPEQVFRPNSVGRFMHEVMRRHSKHYQYQTAQRLAILVAHFSGTAPARQTLADAQASHPYTDRQLVTFRSSAARRTTAERRRNAHTLLGLGAGAGLRAEEIAAARVGDIIIDDDNVQVTVTGRYPRTVPVRADWTRSLRTGIDGRPGEEFAFTGYRLPGYAARVIHQFGIDDPGEDTPSATRLRATWIVGLLNARVPLDLVLKLAGLAEAVSLASYVRAMDTHDVDDFHSLITRPGAGR